MHLTSNQVLLILHHDRMPAYVYSMVGGAAIGEARQLCCVNSGAKICIDDQGQYCLSGYACDGRDVRCYERVIHPWIPKRVQLRGATLTLYYSTYAIIEERHERHYSIKKIKSLYRDKWTQRDWDRFCLAHIAYRASACKGIVPEH